MGRDLEHGIDYRHYTPPSIWLLVNNTIEERDNLKIAIEQRFNVGNGNKYGAVPPKPRLFASYDEAKIAAAKYKWDNVSIVQFVQPDRKS